jgi:hypothetical protein
MRAAGGIQHKRQGEPLVPACVHPSGADYTISWVPVAVGKRMLFTTVRDPLLAHMALEVPGVVARTGFGRAVAQLRDACRNRHRLLALFLTL